MLMKEDFERLSFNQDTKVAIISHNDLDGIGAIIVATNYFKDVKHFTVANHAVDKVGKLVLFSPDYQDRELIFFTDCSLTDEKLINHIDSINNDYKSSRNIFLFDHHPTALFLNKFIWACVTEVDGVSGTKLFWKFMEERMLEHMFTKDFVKLDNLVNVISDYDTWKWVEKGREECRKLSELYSDTGPNYFLTKYSTSAWDLYTEFEIFNDIDKSLLEDFANKFKWLVWPNVEKSARIGNFTFKYGEESLSRRVKAVTVTTSISDMAEKLYEDGVDTIFFFYHDSLSVRTRDPELNAGEWCKQFGGGGHKASAGFRLSPETAHIYLGYLNQKFYESAISQPNLINVELEVEENGKSEV